MTKTSALFPILVTWGLRVTLFSVVVSPLIFSIGGIQDRLHTIRGIEARIERYSTSLSMPKSLNRYVEFERFLEASTSDGEAASDALQAHLSQLLRAGDARLLDLQKLPPVTENTGLVGLRAGAEIEGDLQAVLARLSALEQQLPDLVIVELNLTPRGRTDRPDRSMRLKLEMVQWREETS